MAIAFFYTKWCRSPPPLILTLTEAYLYGHRYAYAKAISRVHGQGIGLNGPGGPCSDDILTPLLC